MKLRPRHRVTGARTLVRAVLRALAICAPGAVLDAPAALAQAPAPATLAAEIPAQPLARALEAFASQTGLQLVYVTEVVRSQRAHAVPAGLTTEESLARMLEGTNLTFEYLTPRTVRILAAVASPPKRTGPAIFGVETLHEVIVTANRRNENAQHVPMTLQVLTDATLAKLSATTFDDFVPYLPGVVTQGVGPAQNNIVIRGLATGVGSIQGAGSIGSFPNVAVYLDEQSAQLPNRNLDIYAADLERIEVLEGPQGTLFGAGAEAGVVRYITNKPKLDLTEARLDVGHAETAHGGPSNSFTAIANLPLIPNRVAVRLVGYNDQRGGYIDNVPATFARASTDPAILNVFGGQVPANSVVLNNSGLIGGDINPVTYQGIRAEALYRFDDDWEALLALSNQNMTAEGVFTEMAANSLGQPVPELSTQLFNPAYDRDRFRNAALTVSGRIGAMKILYAGSFLTRNVEQADDYTQYSRGGSAAYYQCINPGPTFAEAQCFSPSAFWDDAERSTQQSHELRLSTSSDRRVRAIGGLFYEDFRIQEQVDWFYTTALAYFRQIGPPTGYFTQNGSLLLPDGRQVQFNSPGAVFVPSPVTSNNPNLRPPGESFFDDITRGYTQNAAYASIDVDVVPRTLTLTAGTRFSRTKTSELGSTVFSWHCGLLNVAYVPDPCINHSQMYNIDAQHLKKTYSGFTSRANLSWQVTDDALLYFTWSQGFRAGGFNRAPEVPGGGSPLAPGGQWWQAQAAQHGGYLTPVDFAPDSLINNELGWKTRWMDERLQWNGTLYQESWNHAQTAAGGPGVFNAGTVINGGDYRVRGIETSGVARFAAGLTVEAGVAWNKSELVRQATLLWRDGTPIDFATLQDSQGHAVANPSGAVGSPLSGAPPFQGNIRVRFEGSVRGWPVFAQFGAVHQSHSLSTTVRLSHDYQNNSTAYDLPAFTTFGGALGFVRGGFVVQLYGENLTDTRAQLYANFAQQYKAITVNRPRTIGLRLSFSK